MGRPHWSITLLLLLLLLDKTLRGIFFAKKAYRRDLTASVEFPVSLIVTKMPIAEIT